MLGGRVVRAVIATAVAAIVGLAAWHASPVKRLEWNLVDARYDIRGSHATPDVAVVAIDSDTLTKYGRWPIDRRLHAKAIETLRDAGAKRIVYDVQFAGHTKADAPLIAAIDHPDVVLGATEVFDDGTVQSIGPHRWRDKFSYAGFAPDA